MAHKRFNARAILHSHKDKLSLVAIRNDIVYHLPNQGNNLGTF